MSDEHYRNDASPYVTGCSGNTHKSYRFWHEAYAAWANANINRTVRGPLAADSLVGRVIPRPAENGLAHRHTVRALGAGAPAPAPGAAPVGFAYAPNVTGFSTTTYFGMPPLVPAQGSSNPPPPPPSTASSRSYRSQRGRASSVASSSRVSQSSAASTSGSTATWYAVTRGDMPGVYPSR